MDKLEKRLKKKTKRYTGDIQSFINPNLYCKAHICKVY